MDEELKFNLETATVAEMTEEDWSGDDVEFIGEEALAEMTKHDEKPFYVDFTALYEGVSGNGREYTKSAVQSCVKAMLNVNMYKGHENPSARDWQYRSPVGKVVAARLATMTIDGRQVLAAKGKAYITSDDPKLRRDIARKMAGPVSILGTATAVRDLRTGKRTVTSLRDPLKSIDFCNPGTNGMAKAGVESIVMEMSGADADPEPKPEPREPVMGKLTKAELLAQHPDLIEEIVGEQMTSKFDLLATEKQALADKTAEHDAALKAKDEEIAEMNGKLDTATAEKAELQKQLDAQAADLLVSQVEAYKTEAIAEMKADEAFEGKGELVDLAAAGVVPTIVDGDLDKSKTALKASLKAAAETNVKIFEMAGGTKIVQAEAKSTSSKTGNKQVGDDDKSSYAKLRARILAPELVADKN
jgi:hypothetical protein